MYRVTTPTHTFTLPIETGTCSEILITYKQKKLKLDKHYENGTTPPGMTLDGKNVVIRQRSEVKLHTPEATIYTRPIQAGPRRRILTAI